MKYTWWIYLNYCELKLIRIDRLNLWSTALRPKKKKKKKKKDLSCLTNFDNPLHLPGTLIITNEWVKGEGVDKDEWTGLGYFRLFLRDVIFVNPIYMVSYFKKPFLFRCSPHQTGEHSRNYARSLKQTLKLIQIFCISIDFLSLSSWFSSQPNRRRQENGDQQENGKDS